MRLLLHDYAGHPFQIQLSRELARRGHDVLHAYAGSLQTPRGELTKKPSEAPTFDVREISMPENYSQHKYSFIKRRSMELTYGRSAAALIREWQPDVVLSANTPTEPQDAILKATQSLGSRFVMWHQDFYSIAVDKLVRRKIPVLGGLIGSYYRRMEGRQLRASHHVVAITEDFVPLMVQEFGVPPENISVVPNWAPIESLPLTDKENPWSHHHDLHDKFVFLYTGTLGMKHNPGLLLELAKTYREDPHIRVVVISEGIGATWLTEQKAQHGLTNLLLLPYQPFSEMSRVMAAGDVLMAVLEEDAGIFSVPSKVLTCLCAGRPLLLAVPPENLAARMVKDAQTGLTGGSADTATFLANAQQFLTDFPLAVAMGRRARAYAEQTFRIDTICSRFESILS